MLGRVKDSTAFRSVVRAYARLMVSGALEPYDAGLEIWGRAGRESPSDDGDDLHRSATSLGRPDGLG